MNKGNRKMKRVFQWRRYFEWKHLTLEEKLSIKRLLFLPILAYLIHHFFKQNLLLIIFMICGYIIYKKLEKGKANTMRRDFEDNNIAKDIPPPPINEN